VSSIHNHVHYYIKTILWFMIKNYKNEVKILVGGVKSMRGERK
jgi:hypothetical protein